MSGIFKHLHTSSFVVLVCALAVVWSSDLQAQTFENPFDAPPAPRATADDSAPPRDSAAARSETDSDNPFRDDPVQPGDAAARSPADSTPDNADNTMPLPAVDTGTVNAINELLASRKFTEAIPLLESATKQVPEEAEYAAQAYQIWFALGIAYRMTERYDDAIKALTVAAKHAFPAEDESAAYLRRGIVWYYKREPRIAVLDFEHAASASNSDPRPEFWKGLVLADQGKYRQAITSYSNALRLYSGYTIARNNRGLAYLAMGEIDFAVADFDEVIRQTPDSASAYYKRAIALGRRGDFREAIASYGESIRLDAKFAPAYYNRGLLHRRLGNSTQADADLAKARELDPQIGEKSRVARLASR